MAENEVIIHVKSEDQTERGFSAARQGAKKLADDIERNLKTAGARAGRSLADGIRDGLKAGHPLIIRGADATGDGVAQELKQSGDKAGRGLGDGISDGLRGVAPEVIAEAKLLGKTVEAEMGSAGTQSGKKLGQGIKSGISGASDGIGDGIIGALKSVASNPIVASALTAVGVAGAGVIGGALGAAVIGGAGGLGIVGGFAAAAMDPLVQGASIALKDIVSNDLEDAAKAFVPSAVDAINQVHAAWKRMLPTIENIFEQSGGLVEPLLGGILDGVDALINGIDDSLSTAGPVFEAFGSLFRDALTGLGDVFTGLSDDTEDIASTIGLLSEAITISLDVIQAFIEVTTAVTGPLIRGAEAARSWTHELFDGRDGIEEVSLKGAVWHDVTEETTGAINDQISALRALEQEMRKQTDPLFEIFELQTKVGKAQETYNESLEKNGPHAAKTRKALLDMGKASFELTSALTSAASEGFDGKLTPAMRDALRNAGNTAKQIDALEKELIAAWRAANKWSGTYTQTYITRYKEYGLKSPSAGGGFQGLATGGIVGAATGGAHSGLRMVGEAGPELVNLPPGTQVHSNPDTQRMLASEAGRSAEKGIKVSLSFDPSRAPEAIRGIMEGIRAEVRDGGGSVQTVLGPR